MESIAACISQNISRIVARSHFFLTKCTILLASANQKQAGISKMALSFIEDTFAFIEILGSIHRFATPLWKTANEMSAGMTD